jgi:hypothetical protein
MLEGNAYVPLHPQQPLERNVEIITQADVELEIYLIVKTKFRVMCLIYIKSIDNFKIDKKKKIVS